MPGAKFSFVSTRTYWVNIDIKVKARKCSGALTHPESSSSAIHCLVPGELQLVKVLGWYGGMVASKPIDPYISAHATISFLPSSTSVPVVHKPPPSASVSSTPRSIVTYSQPVHPHRLAYTMAVSRSPNRSPRRRSSPVASSSRGSVSHVLNGVSKLYKKAVHGGASRSGSPTRALTIGSAEFPLTGLATEREEEDEVNKNDPNDTLDDGDLPADATDELPYKNNAIEDPTKDDTPETRNVTADDTAATVKDALPTSSIAAGSANARHASPSSTSDEASSKLTLPGFIARSDGGQTTGTKESVSGTDGLNITEVTDNLHTDVPVSYPVTDGAAIPIAAGSSTHTITAFSENGEQPQSASNKGKKRARSYDNDESPTSSGDAQIYIDEQHPAKRAKHSMCGSSICHGSASPRRPGATIDIDANGALPTPEGSQEHENEEDIPAAIPSLPMAQVIATLTFHGLVTPDASIASDDDSDSSYSPSSSESSSSDSDDTDTGSGDESDDDTAAPPAPAPPPVFVPPPPPPPVFVVPPPPPPPLVPPPNQLRRTRAFYGYTMLFNVLQAPYI
ncbi:hypothetical protein BD410DRAFT_840103 [Rickenella mellea]|uniref:Uncharacterized protein n=1 Tax=Rickenella mellea TaxID=50990 RepID=A0A4Y7Q3V3_9AGAM|nr:hypothetical protein BD410DRAFT_840103 [Rickenella mellea]